MDIKELIRSRHSVREYLDKPIEIDKQTVLNEYVKELNAKYNTDVVIVFDDDNGFKNAKTGYGNFCNCKNYIVLIGKDAEICGYVGELIVLKAQEMGLNTCFVALTYKKGAVKKAVDIPKGEKIQCSVALGYGKTQGHARKSKSVTEVLDSDGTDPDNIDEIVEACLLAPTAVNQQKFRIVVKNGEVDVIRSGFGFYADFDLGCVKANKDLITGKITL